MRLGAIHAPVPDAVPALAARARLSALPVPTHVDWFSECPADGDALGNDAIGNCVEVADLRAIQVRRRVAHGDAWVPTREMALARYARLTGFDPASGSPDLGTDTAVDLADWVTNGIQVNNQDLEAVLWATVDPRATVDVVRALAHMGPLLVTLNLPLAAQDPNAWGRAPDSTHGGWRPGSWGCHRVVLGAFDAPTGWVVRSWGWDVHVHPAFWDAYVLGVDVTLSRAWLDVTGRAPPGLDWDALAAELGRLTPPAS